jgi:hypothetical protein
VRYATKIGCQAEAVLARQIEIERPLHIENRRPRGIHARAVAAQDRRRR